MDTALEVGQPRGEDHANATLTEDQIRSIRSEHARGVGYRRLARHFGVSPAHVARIVKRRAWAHVQDQTSAA